MELEFDPDKDAENRIRRGLSFTMVATLDWDAALVKEDTRRDYGERRWQAFLYGQGKPYVVVYTMRDRVRRIISFRRARKAERELYEQKA